MKTPYDFHADLWKVQNHAARMSEYATAGNEDPAWHEISGHLIRAYIAYTRMVEEKTS